MNFSKWKFFAWGTLNAWFAILGKTYTVKTIRVFNIFWLILTLIRLDGSHLASFVGKFYKEGETIFTGCKTEFV